MDSHTYAANNVNDDFGQASRSIDISTFGAEVMRSNFNSRRASSASTVSLGIETPATGAQTPDPLLGQRDALSRVPSRNRERDNDVLPELQPTPSRLAAHGHMGDAFENLSRARTNTSMQDFGDGTFELKPTRSRVIERRLTPHPTDGRRPSHVPGIQEEAGVPKQARGQARPPELRNLASELIFVTVCSMGQLLFSFLLGNVTVTQQALKEALGIQSAEVPWLVGSFLTALGLSVVLSGSLADLLPPKLLMVGAFAWVTIWNVIGVFSLTPERSILFFIARAMQGLAVGVLVSGSMSILGRVYSPGQRKTRVFSAMAGAAPFGYWIGAIQGGALSAHLEWIFGTSAIVCALTTVGAYFTIPALRPVSDIAGANAPTFRDFDVKGAVCAVVGCVCLLFGLTQGSVAHWSPYTYALIIVGIASIVLFFWVEGRASRPLIPNSLWKTPGFAPLMLGYFLGFGSFNGAWQFYAIQFWLNIQHVSALTAALYLLPNAILGVAATFIVSRLMHKIPGHYIFLTSMFAFALGPAFFLPQTANTSYWALSMPGVALATFGPDLSFAAASIFITSNVARSYQGSAGSLLVTVQNLSAAIMTSVGDSIASKVGKSEDGNISLEGLKAAWWFALGASLAGGAVTAIWVRIPKEEEKEHIQ
ncbi:MFS general substrate transporter [Polychaeton citri CBS 116435]|uniref:MFS general substrate transporter n=1 Tax=Polychaeton citri CBS 116435 TaxID=1314669 RepID=A0A9P4Q2K4_9PEZI|nr:MFS general substrate transporter [Polychaeton citri CBS 116435]